MLNTERVSLCPAFSLLFAFTGLLLCVILVSSQLALSLPHSISVSLSCSRSIFHSLFAMALILMVRIHLHTHTHIYIVVRVHRNPPRLARSLTQPHNINKIGDMESRIVNLRDNTFMRNCPTRVLFIYYRNARAVKSLKCI